MTFTSDGLSLRLTSLFELVTTTWSSMKTSIRESSSLSAGDEGTAFLSACADAAMATATAATYILLYIVCCEIISKYVYTIGT